jgi:hypothetical protein
LVLRGIAILHFDETACKLRELMDAREFGLCVRPESFGVNNAKPFAKDAGVEEQTTKTKRPLDEVIPAA